MWCNQSPETEAIGGLWARAGTAYTEAGHREGSYFTGEAPH